MNCIDRNSEISGYTVRYGPVGGTAANDSVSGTNHRAYTAVGLTPSTNYSIEVAAVNSDGVGPFSSTIFVRTPDLDSEWGGGVNVLQSLERECCCIMQHASGCIYTLNGK